MRRERNTVCTTAAIYYKTSFKKLVLLFSRLLITELTDNKFLESKSKVSPNIRFLFWTIFSKKRSHGVMVSTLDFESSDPSSNLGGTFIFDMPSNSFLQNLMKSQTCLQFYINTWHSTFCQNPADRFLYT